MKYAVVIEKANGNYSAYVPDLPGCVATGKTPAQVRREIRKAVRFHIEGLREDGLPVPNPVSRAEYVEAYTRDAQCRSDSACDRRERRDQTAFPGMIGCRRRDIARGCARRVERVAGTFGRFAEVRQADRRYHLELSPQQRLDNLLGRVARSRDSRDEPAQGLARVHRIVERPPGPVAASTPAAGDTEPERVEAEHGAVRQRVKPPRQAGGQRVPCRRLASLSHAVVSGATRNRATAMTYHGIQIDREVIADFCRRHRIRRLSLFGSILRDDFRPDSDIDVLVEFEAGARTGLAFFGMQDELSGMLGRTVDLNTPQFLSKYFRDEVLHEARVLYAAA